MTNDDDTNDPLPGLDHLPREAPPPTGVEERVVVELRRRGLLRRPGRRLRLPITLAAGLALFAAGVATGRLRSAPPEEGGGPRFLLLLYTGSDASRLAAREESARVREYAAWARALRGKGSLVAGEKLEDEGVPLGGAPPRDDVRGYFVIAAPDLAAARSIAEGCPHVAHGGVVVVRPIADTRSRS